MARNSYKLNFIDKTIVYSDVHNSSIECRILPKEQMEIMQLTLFDIEESNFSCTEEEFYKGLTPGKLEWLREHRLNQFKFK